MRELTQQEIDNAPDWATCYYVHGSILTPCMTSYYGEEKVLSRYHSNGHEVTQIGRPVFYRAKPIPRKPFNIASAKLSSGISMLGANDSYVTVEHDNGEMVVVGKEDTIALAKHFKLI